MDETKVLFQTSNKLVQKLYDSAEEKCRQNIKSFAGRRVLIEGGGYNKVWIETQPMGGAMFAMSTLSLVPVFLIFLIFNRYLVEGIGTSGLKG